MEYYQIHYKEPDMEYDTVCPELNEAFGTHELGFNGLANNLRWSPCLLVSLNLESGSRGDLSPAELAAERETKAQAILDKLEEKRISTTNPPSQERVAELLQAQIAHYGLHPQALHADREDLARQKKWGAQSNLNAYWRNKFPETGGEGYPSTPICR